MYDTALPDSDQPYADWYIRFAGNHVVLAYTHESLAAEEVNADNWYQVLARPEVRFGLSDPRLDAAGYRSLMIVQLAESYYNDPTLFERIFLGRFNEPIQVTKEDGRLFVQVPELLATRPDSSIRLRGGSVALLGLLESGDIDYAFEYESVARQHGLEFVELPPALNLGDPAQAAHYAGITVRLDYQRFASVRPEFVGERISYAVTIPANAPQPELAQDFVAFLLGPQGAQIMETHDHPVFAQPEVDNCPALPAGLQEFCD
jgi:molybdate/tungstate transport system substrate-binding protein